MSYTLTDYLNDYMIQSVAALFLALLAGAAGFLPQSRIKYSSVGALMVGAVVLGIIACQGMRDQRAMNRSFFHNAVQSHQRRRIAALERTDWLSTPEFKDYALVDANAGGVHGLPPEQVEKRRRELLATATATLADSDARWKRDVDQFSIFYARSTR